MTSSNSFGLRSVWPGLRHAILFACIDSSETNMDGTSFLHIGENLGNSVISRQPIGLHLYFGLRLSPGNLSTQAIERIEIDLRAIPQNCGVSLDRKGI
jgi:hypothetical protein